MIVCILCFIIHTVWIVILAYRLLDNASGYTFATIWILYFVFTEQAPVTLILYLISRLTSSKRKQVNADEQGKPLLTQNPNILVYPNVEVNL
jgi:hypothetical protein